MARERNAPVDWSANETICSLRVGQKRRTIPLISKLSAPELLIDFQLVQSGFSLKYNNSMTFIGGESKTNLLGSSVQNKALINPVRKMTSLNVRKSDAHLFYAL